MNEIPMGPPPAKPSVIETFNDFCAWLDEARDAEEPPNCSGGAAIDHDETGICNHGPSITGSSS